MTRGRAKAGGVPRDPNRRDIGSIAVTGFVLAGLCVAAERPRMSFRVPSLVSPTTTFTERAFSFPFWPSTYSARASAARARGDYTFGMMLSV